MTITLEEARKQYAKAKAEAAESLVKKQWLRILVGALEEQEQSGSAEPDFSPYWMNVNYELAQAVGDYHEAYELETENKDNQTLIIEMFKCLIGDQLDEYSLTPQFFDVYCGFESATWLFFLKPGQKPSY